MRFHLLSDLIEFCSNDLIHLETADCAKLLDYENPEKFETTDQYKFNDEELDLLANGINIQLFQLYEKKKNHVYNVNACPVNRTL